MAGANLNPIGVINQIADNLRDRYENGFPVLKEIIQNSDDANADTLVIGWSNGLDGPENPLLASPGLFFINNAPLAEEHERGIRSIAESTKASTKSSVGKFGLGMKSLFHLCEAFFYQADNWREDDWAGEVFNPWDKKYRPEWNNYSNNDKAKLEQKLKSVLANFKKKNDAPWFIVWVPLRNSKQTSSYEDDAIISNFYNEEVIPGFLTDDSLPSRIAEIFPLLKNLLQVELVVEDAEEFTRLFVVNLEKDSSRSIFNGQPVLPDGNSEAKCRGGVNFLSQGQQHKVRYTGYERILSLNELTQLQSVEKGWPVSYQHDSKSNRPKKALDKAEQHVAVVISKTSATGQAYLRANWAVFLPLADMDDFVSQAIEGEYDYSIHLHGYFFVDAGRKGIHGHENIGNSVEFEDINGDEKKLRRAWNVALANEGTLDVVLVALEHFVKSKTCTKDEIEIINRGIKNIFPKEYLSRVTANHQWVFKVNHQCNDWQRLSIKNKFRFLPQPASSDYKRVWEALPKLEMLDSNYILVERDKPNITNSAQIGWNADELKSILSVDVQNIFSSSILLEYLNKFIRLTTESLQSEQVESLVSPLIREALAKIDLAVLSNRTKLFQDLLNNLKAEHRVVLPVAKEDGELWFALAATKLDMLLIPSFLDHTEQKSNGVLNVIDSIEILKALDRFLRQQINLESAIKTAEKLVTHILQKVRSASKDGINQVYQQCGNLRLFRVLNLSIEYGKLMSLDELKKSLQQKKLFVRSPGPSFGIGENLVQATQNLDVLYITKDDAKVIFDDQDVPECGPLQVLASLALNYPQLNQESARKSLLLKLSGQEKFDDEGKRGFRYLLHGHSEDDLTHALWKRAPEAKDVWVKLWKNSTKTENAAWSVISDYLGGALNDDLKGILNIHEISPSGVLSKLRDEICLIDYADENFSHDDFEEILTQIDDKDLWCQVPIHLTTNNYRVSINDKCLLNGHYELPDGFDVTPITRSATPIVLQKQIGWIGEATAAQLLKISLNQTNPDSYAEFILRQLKKLAEDKSPPDQEINQLVKDTAWIPLVNGKTASPAQVIDADIDSWPQVNMLCDYVETVCFTTEHIHGRLAKNGEYLKIFKNVIVTPKKSCELIFKNAIKLSHYALGDIGSLTTASVKEIIQLPKVLKMFPGWQLVAEYYENLDGVFDVQAALVMAQKRPNDSIVEGLEAIADEESPQNVEHIRHALLTAICRSNDPIESLRNLRVRTMAGTYMPATQLVRNVTQVKPEFIAHDTEYEVFEKVLNQYSMSTVPLDRKTEINADSDSPATLLKKYFQPWERHVQSDSIAMLLTLMCGDEEIKTYVNQLFRGKTYQGVLEAFAEQWQSKCRLPGPWSGFPFKTLIETVRFKPIIIANNKGIASSIFGEKVEVELTSKISSIVVVQKTQQRPNDKLYHIQLRTIDPKELDRSQLHNLLQSGAELLLELFGHSLRLNQLWSEVGESNQLDIKLAKRMVLEKIVPTLERLRVKEHGVGELLIRHGQAVRYCCESKTNTRAEIENVLVDIQKLIETDESLKKEILRAVRHEIGTHSQYFPDSVPFELFQNADDAVDEKQRMDGADYTNDANSKFIIKYETAVNALDFYHWGREINYCKVGYVEGEGRYARDLEKMVSLNVSDKTPTSTGKFGLGFKSCLLICDEPEIHSGDVIFNIHAGILPAISPSSEVLTERVQNHIFDGVQPTLTRLKLLERFTANPSEITSRFKQASGVLCVFSKHIRRIEIDNEIIEWRPTRSSRIQNLNIGSVKLPSAAGLKNQKVLHYQGSSGQFLFQLQAKGFVSLEDKKLSKFWVLNPLQEDLPAGFIVDGNFQVDIGRSQLAKNDEANLAVMAKLGNDLALMLTEVFEWTQEDWAGFKLEWDLSPTLGLNQFWGTLWNVLTSAWPAGLSSTDNKAILFKELFIAPGALLDFYNRCSAIPNNMAKSDLSLVSLKKAEFSADKLLTSAYVDLRTLPQIRQLVAAEGLVSYQVGYFLKQIGRELKSLSILELLNGYLPGEEVSIEAAVELGKLFNSDFEAKMSDYQAHCGEMDSLKSALQNLLFKNLAGGWSRAQDLDLFESDYESEDVLLAQFASPSCVIAEAYCEHGQLFFKYCQSRNRRNIEAWARSIQGSELNRQIALLNYMISHGGAGLLEKLKANPPDWMRDNALDATLLKNKFRLNEIQVEKFYAKWNDTDEDLRRRGQQRIREESQSQYSPEQALMKVHDWWIDVQLVELSEYNQRLYSSPLPWEKMKNDVGLLSLEARSGWLKLFYLGACQSMGRTTEVQHRAAMDWFEQRGWWDKIATRNRLRAEDWTEIIEEYLTESKVNERYRQWLQILPLYRFATNLQDYVDLFLCAGQIDNLDDLLASTSSPLLHGSGISVPELKATLGIGVNFVIRELIRHQVIDSDATKYAFTMPGLVRKALTRVGYPALNGASPYESERAFEYISDLIGEELATFEMSFDIPFRIIWQSEALKRDLLGVGAFEHSEDLIEHE
jgi:hypothetical protein